MQSIARQNRAELGGRLSVLYRQKRDHVRLDRLLHRLGGAPPDEQGRLLRKIYRLVFPHAFAEEALLWPVIRRVLPDGHVLTLRVEQEHQAINELVTRLETLAPGSAAHEAVLGEVAALLSQDVRDEEDALLPRLQGRLSGAELRRLGIAWEAVRWIAPTRAHPIVSRRPPGNVLSALPLAVVDRCRDLMEGVLDRSPDAVAAPLRGLSSGLAAASHGIERLPGMRRGEDTSTRIGRRSRGGWALVAVAALAVGTAAAAAARRRGERQRASGRSRTIASLQEEEA